VLDGRNLDNRHHTTLSFSCADQQRMATSHEVTPDVPQLRFARLFSSELVSVTHVCCHPNERGCGTAEAATHNDVVLPQRGVFVKHIGNAKVVAHRATVLFFAAGREYRVSHPVGDGDECMSLRYAPEVLVDTMGNVRQNPRHFREDAPFAGLDAAAAAAAAVFAGQQLRTLIKRSAAPIAIEETALELLRSAVANEAQRETRALRADTEIRARRWAHDVELRLASDPGKRWTLAALGREVGSSPFHLARRFRSVTGSSIHSRLRAIRLAAAVERVMGGEDDLSNLALELGFSSHAHLSTAFRKAYGASPSAVRQSAFSA
jgi:AraC-like DNA-binding protein